MNKKWIQSGLILVCGGMLVLGATAQPPRARDGEGEGRGRRRERSEDVQRGDMEGLRAYVEQWLAGIQERDPAEYDRLVALREEHPVAFRMEMRRRVQEGRVLQVVREEFPGFYEYLQSLDQQERDRLGNFLQRMAENRPGADARPRSRFADFEGDVELRRLAQRWREADEEERGRIRRRMRNQIEELFDERTEAQQGEVDQLEEQLRRLRTMLETRQSRRVQWIDQVLERLTAMEE